MKKILQTLLVLTLFPVSTLAQEQDITLGFKAQNWFPLEVGNFWQWSPDDGIDKHLYKADSAEVIENQRWIRLSMVFGDGPNFREWYLDRKYWLSWTLDGYLLVKTNLDNPADTVLQTKPYSFFQVKSPTDTLKYLSDTDRARDSAYVSLNEQPDISDSTRFMLNFNGTDLVLTSPVGPHFGTFRYNIGPTRLGFLGSHLNGAIIDDKTYGNPDLYERYLPIETPSARPQSYSLQAYPNPFNPSTTIQMRVPATGTYRMEVINLLGQTVQQKTLHLHAGQSQRLELNMADHASGVYRVTLYGQNGPSRSISVTLLK